MELQDLHEFINHFWQFMKATWGREYTDEYLLELLNAAGKIADAYERHDLAKRLLTAYIEYQEAEWKRQEEEKSNEENTH